MSFTKEWNVYDIKEMYSNLTILSNEDNIVELGFKDKVDKNILGDLVISYHFCINSIKKMILLIQK